MNKEVEDPTPVIEKKRKKFFFEFDVRFTLLTLSLFLGAWTASVVWWASTVNDTVDSLTVSVAENTKIVQNLKTIITNSLLTHSVEDVKIKQDLFKLNQRITETEEILNNVWRDLQKEARNDRNKK